MRRSYILNSRKNGKPLLVVRKLESTNSTSSEVRSAGGIRTIKSKSDISATSSTQNDKSHVAGSEKKLTNGATKFRKFKAPRTKLLNVGVSEISKIGNIQSKPKPMVEPKYYSVMYCKRSNKKHKSYQDGVLIVCGNKFTLKDMEGKDIGRPSTLHRMAELGEGSEFYMGSNEIEVSEPIDKDRYESGSIFIAPTAKAAVTSIPLVKRRKLGSSMFKVPFRGKGSCLLPGFKSAPTKPKQRNDTSAAGALILNEALWKSKEDDVAVVVDQFIGSKLRPHQSDGMKFMYECLMGHRNPGYNGAILADEMGLGKTLQSIALIWTLLKDGPDGRPTVRKALIVTPSTLVRNWEAECRKWLGTQRLCPLVLQGSSEGAKKYRDQIRTFCKSSQYPVMIISYELFKRFPEIVDAQIGILVCDEGHRLKNAQGNQTIRALNAVKCSRRLLITGTPVQNNLEELFAMCQFVNPGCLGPLAAFRRVYAQPVSRSRDTQARPEEKRIGEERGAELARRTSSFIIRRTKDLLKQYLPPKRELVVFCRMSQLQVDVYQQYLRSETVRRLLSTKDRSAQSLQCLNALCKIANSPSLVYAKKEKEEWENRFRRGDVANAFPDDYDPEVVSVEESGKLNFLFMLLDEMWPNTAERIVISSSKTQTLDLIARALDDRARIYLRLDGTTPVTRRSQIVSRFNAPEVVRRKEGNGVEPSGQPRILLLSARAGGCGLNLIGAHRLVLFEPDWNPANDAQVMNRIWRDGQTNTCVIYRPMSVGSIDERIFQRQLTKQEMASIMNKNVDVVRHFSREELRKVFTLEHTTQHCNTYDLLRDKLNAWTVSTDNESMSELDDLLSVVQKRMGDQLPIVFSQLVTAESIEKQIQPTSGEDDISSTTSQNLPDDVVVIERSDSSVMKRSSENLAEIQIDEASSTSPIMSRVIGDTSDQENIAPTTFDDVSILDDSDDFSVSLSSAGRSVLDVHVPSTSAQSVLVQLGKRKRFQGENSDGYIS
eukprot:909211_1